MRMQKQQIAALKASLEEAGSTIISQEQQIGSLKASLEEISAIE